MKMKFTVSYDIDRLGGDNKSELRSQGTQPKPSPFPTVSDREDISSAVDACLEGLAGVFIPLANDFSRSSFVDQNEKEFYQDQAHWSSEKRKRVRRFRYVICSLVLAAMAFALMARMILPVAIVEMTKAPAESENENQLVHPFNDTTSQESGQMNFVDESMGDVNNEGPEHHQTTQRFDWSVADKNFITGSFYIGYAPSMLLSGSLTEKYGAKIPLFVAIFGTVIINALLPTLALMGMTVLVIVRITMGFIQGCLVPAVYELYNKWLTQTEMSIFTPLLKMSLALGTLTGAFVPGVISKLELSWTMNFYVSCIPCALWSIVWLMLASSTPQTNAFVTEDELERIMRKKIKIEIPVKKPEVDASNKPKLSVPQSELEPIPKDPEDKTPWLAILLNPSVLALTLTKFTYNLGFDFVALVLPNYLDAIHEAPTSTISAISSGSYLVQFLLIVFVGWLAKYTVQNEALGLSRTKWRKVFQGSSNLGMAVCFVGLAMAGPRLWLVTVFILLICFTHMFGAGGESMVPYDLSSKYPATIMGVAHSISIFSGVLLPLVVNLVLGGEDRNPDRWNFLFLLIAASLALGGIVFILVLKAKPFLPSERAPRNNSKDVAVGS